MLAAAKPKPSEPAPSAPPGDQKAFEALLFKSPILMELRDTSADTVSRVAALGEDVQSLNTSVTRQSSTLDSLSSVQERIELLLQSLASAERPLTATTRAAAARTSPLAPRNLAPRPDAENPCLSPSLILLPASADEAKNEVAIEFAEGLPLEVQRNYYLTMTVELHEAFAGLFGISPNAQAALGVPWSDFGNGVQAVRVYEWWLSMRKAKTVDNWWRKLAAIQSPTAGVAPVAVGWDRLLFWLLAGLNDTWTAPLQPTEINHTVADMMRRATSEPGYSESCPLLGGQP